MKMKIHMRKSSINGKREEVVVLQKHKNTVCVGQQKYKRIREETKKDYMQERHKRYSFPYRSIETWYKLDAKVINARNIHDFKSKLDNSRFRDGTVRT